MVSKADGGVWDAVSTRTASIACGAFITTSYSLLPHRHPDHVSGATTTTPTWQRACGREFDSHLLHQAQNPNGSPLGLFVVYLRVTPWNVADSWGPVLTAPFAPQTPSGPYLTLSPPVFSPTPACGPDPKSAKAKSIVSINQ